VLFDYAITQFLLHQTLVKSNLFVNNSMGVTYTTFHLNNMYVSRCVIFKKSSAQKF